MRRTIYRDSKTGRFIKRSTWRRSKAQGGTRFKRQTVVVEKRVKVREVVVEKRVKVREVEPVAVPPPEESAEFDLEFEVGEDESTPEEE